MKYEEPEVEVIELVARDVFMTASPGGGTVGWQPGGGGGDFEDDNDPDDF